MIETYLLEQLVAFSECGTLLKASESLHVTQPALSRSMKKLEQELGISIFYRENSKITLNETGKVAVEYAKKALEANQEFENRVLAFDRSLRTINLGSCAPLPITDLVPVLQDRMPGKTITAEIASDEELISRLKNHFYQLVILHQKPTDKSIFYQRLLNEQLYISLPKGHPLSKKKSVTLKELQNIRMLANGNIGFWKELLLQYFSIDNILFQNNFDAYTELIHASNLPFFNSNQYLQRGYDEVGRISIPITDEEVQVTYYLACLESDQKKYRSIFNYTRGIVLS